MSITDQITETLGTDADQFDIDAITETIHEQYGTATIDAIPTDEFWDIVLAHPAPDPGPTEAEQFRTDLTAAIAIAPAGQLATWTDRTITVTVIGASRVRHIWPQILAEVSIATPSGETNYISGDAIASWEDLWQRVEDARDSWEGDTDRLLAGIARRHDEVAAAESAVARARSARDRMIRSAAGEGVTAYRIAKALGVAESTIGRILK